MKMKNMQIGLFTVVILVTGFVSCGKKDNPNPTPKPSVSVTDSVRALFNPQGAFTYYSFKDSSVVASSDSNSTKWDFAFRFVNIIVNSHASGPGNAGVIFQSGVYDNFTTAPENGYAYDTSKTQLAINANYNDPSSWYLYLPDHTLIPVAGKFFVFRTADGHYVKMEILSVTTDIPPSSLIPPTYIWYKFRYSYQADGSRNF